jgi:hypothetical protein
MDRSRLGFALVLGMVAACLLAGCGGGTSPPVDTTPEGRIEVMSAVDARLARLSPTQPIADSVRSIASYMASRPEFVTTGSSEDLGTAWGTLSDGTLYAAAVPQGAVATRDDRAGAAWTRATTAPRTGVARGPAVVYQTLGDGYVDATAMLRPWLLSAGYSVNEQPTSHGTVADLMGLRGPGVFYIGTHGCVIAPEPGYKFLLQTATAPTAKNLVQYAEDLADGSLVVFSWGPSGQRYAITEKFVRDHMRFGPNSLVYIDACHSAQLPSFRQACFDAGASVFAGWDGSVADPIAARAAAFMFDRMLGSNAADYADPTPPPLRPFDYASAYTELRLRGWNVDLQWGAKHPITLQIAEGPGAGAWLTPSIECLRVDEDPAGARAGESELTIRGTFGVDPGDAVRLVRCGGEVLSVKSWSENRIVCLLPVTGAGSAGEVVVEIDHHRSNAVPLTEWWLAASYRPNAFDQITLTCHLRYDIHGFRQGITNAPSYLLPIPGETPTSIARDSYGGWHSSGTENVLDPLTHQLSEVHVFSGSGALHFDNGTGHYVSGFSQLHYDYPSAGSRTFVGPTGAVLFIRAKLFAESSGKVMESHNPDGSLQYTNHLGVAINPGFGGVPEGQEIDLQFDKDWAIEEGSAGDLSWSKAAARFAPTEVTPRSVAAAGP